MDDNTRLATDLSALAARRADPGDPSLMQDIHALRATLEDGAVVLRDENGNHHVTMPIESAISLGLRVHGLDEK